MLADVTRFRTLVGAANQAGALARIYNGALPPPVEGAGMERTVEELKALRPFARVWTSPVNGYSIRARGTNGATRQWGDKGTVFIEIEDNVAAGISDDESAVQIAGEDLFGEIIQGLIGLIGGASYLNVTDIEVVDGPGRIAQEMWETYGDTIGGILKLEWES